MRFLLLGLCLLGYTQVFAGERLTIAAASDLRYALDDIVAEYRQQEPDARIDVVYGSSGKMTSQITHGAPYDLFFSADIRYPQQLFEAGLTTSEPVPYARGRIVLWSTRLDAAELTLEDLPELDLQRIAIAQPSHAPYGARAKEALISAGVWDAVEPKLVYGENIAHTAQMVQSGAADIGIIALSLALFPQLATDGHYLIPEAGHQPLVQGYVTTRQVGDRPLAERFRGFLQTGTAHAILDQYGFTLE